MHFCKSVALLLVSALLLTLLMSCAKSLEGAETDETTAAVSNNVTEPVESEKENDTEESDAETLPADDVPIGAYDVKGEYTVLSEVSFSVMTKIGDKLTQQVLRLAVIDRKEDGVATYMDVADASGAILCKQIISGFTTVYVDCGTDDATRIAVFRCAFRDGESGAELSLGFCEYELSDRLFDLAGTQTGELGFRLYNAHAATDISTGFDLSGSVQLDHPIRNLANEVAKTVCGVFALALDSYTQDAYTVIPTESPTTDTILGAITLDAVEAIYINRIYDDTSVDTDETTSYDDSADPFE